VSVNRPRPSRNKIPSGSVPYASRLAEALESVPSKGLPARHRCVLLVLAGFCDPDGSNCYPSTARVALRCGLTRRRVGYVLAELEAARWIGRAPRFLPNSGGQTSTLYTVALNGGPVAQLPRARPGRATAFKKPLTKAERDAAGVTDIAAARAHRRAHPKHAPRTS